MSGHTPGPWSLNVDGCGDVFVSGSNSGYVVTIGAVDEDEYGRADACLIAAAPDLYAALDYAVKHIEIELGYDHDAAVNGRAILAKARGER